MARIIANRTSYSTRACLRWGAFRWAAAPAPAPCRECPRGVAWTGPENRREADGMEECHGRAPKHTSNQRHYAACGGRRARSMGRWSSCCTAFRSSGTAGGGRSPAAAAGYRVLVPDQRGYNRSDKPRGVRAYRADVLADDIVGLMDAVGRRARRRLSAMTGAAVVAWVPDAAAHPTAWPASAIAQCAATRRVMEDHLRHDREAAAAQPLCRVLPVAGPA